MCSASTATGQRLRFVHNWTQAGEPRGTQPGPVRLAARGRPGLVSMPPYIDGRGEGFARSPLPAAERFFGPLVGPLLRPRRAGHRSARRARRP